ncbi:hypothetical protein BO82DRAFT_431580 [Aspergillus uvarum CBS 121591]|uniref:SMP-30/Gluconolactonase/LRE-like region domain-containing protein n=1 Tax=Aspergillus uvarum CBS 121591 TaxID=1448315 RepID=A0A319CUZ8_9EURO|nr:hypothetical protein BO82DRAFT_431580 [Aspergillus uvarum CBS 121591]PYH82663.1 hypothetical protein BO82DRAFT_431580 [Aspergillus uvarum CBS 121591]
MLSNGVFWLVAISLVSGALSLQSTTTYPLTVIGDESSLPHTFENIATRHNGQLLVTSVVSPYLHQVSPLKENQVSRVVRVPQTTGLLGIAELEQDIFYVISANLSGASGVPGSNAVWKVDLRNLDLSSEFGAVHVPVSLVAKLPSAGLLNGMCRMSENSTSSLLIADSQAGQIYKLDVHSGSVETTLNETALKDTQTGLQVAANGIHTYKSNVYFTNLNQGIFGRIPINTQNGRPTGPVDVIVRGVPGDDFVLSPNGQRAWIAINGHRKLIEVDIAARSAQVVVESSYLASASAVTLGRTLLDRNSLYISSAGVEDPSVGKNNNATGGIVARVDVLKVTL